MDPDSIICRVDHTFEVAKASGDLLWFDSSSHDHLEGEIQFNIRLCPALRGKPPLRPLPKVDPDHSPKKAEDPFKAPYSDLFVGELVDEQTKKGYVVLLNKYSVVPSHFLLVTKEFQSQTSPLSPADLLQAMLLLRAARRAGRTFFSFFNCGELSGASQIHKHLQFLPVSEDGPPVEILARETKLENESKPFSIAALPYANHIHRLPIFSDNDSQQTISETLAAAYIALLDQLYCTLGNQASRPQGPPSYNILMTLSHIHLIPRVKEKHRLPTGYDLSVNALGFAGLLLVQCPRELQAVRDETVLAVLEDVGFPKTDNSLCSPTEDPESNE